MIRTEWYDFKEYPDDYTAWWGIDILPRINPDKAECADFIAGEGGVVDKYSKLGIAGMRLDVADELSDEFIAKIRDRIKKNNKDGILYGEVWEDASSKIAYGKRKQYFLGGELDGVMNYPLRRGIIDYLRYGLTDTIKYAIIDIINNAPEAVSNMQMNLLGSHDTERIITALAAPTSDAMTPDGMASFKLTEKDRAEAIKLLCTAYTLVATLPGIPSIYYGDEIGLEGYSDPFNRKTFPWERADSIDSPISHYRRVGKLRRSCDAYKAGEFKLLYIDSDLLLFKRTGNGFDYVTAINRGDSSITLRAANEISSQILNKTSKEHLLVSKTSEIYRIKTGTILEIIK